MSFKPIEFIRNIFNPDNKDKMINGLLNVKDNQELFDSLTALQNEITVGFNTKVIAITSIKNDDLAAAFAKGFAEAYSLNGAKSLIIDANLYNPCLDAILNKGEKQSIDVETDEDLKMINVDKNVDAYCLNKETYPSEVYKSQRIHKLIEDNKEAYDHFIVLVPSVKEHKEIVLLSDILDTSILVVRKNVTKKEHIFNAVQFFELNKLPLAKTVILK